MGLLREFVKFWFRGQRWERLEIRSRRGFSVLEVIVGLEESRYLYRELFVGVTWLGIIGSLEFLRVIIS